MFKIKNVLGVLCAICLTASGGIAVYADSSDSVSGYLSSCGEVGGYSTAFTQGSSKYVKSDTYAANGAYKLRADMQAVNRNTGSTLASASDQQYNAQTAVASQSVSAGTSVTVYGAHQVWGTSSEYWGKYTTVYD